MARPTRAPSSPSVGRRQQARSLFLGYSARRQDTAAATEPASYRIVGDAKLGLSLAICAGKSGRVDLQGCRERRHARLPHQPHHRRRRIGRTSSPPATVVGCVTCRSPASATSCSPSAGWRRRMDRTAPACVLRSTESAAVEPAIEKKYKFGPAQFKTASPSRAPRPLPWWPGGRRQPASERFDVCR